METSCSAEVATLDNDSLREEDARVRFSACHRLPDGATLDLDVVTAFHACPDAIEDEIIWNGVGPVHLRPCPGEDRPRPPDLASEQGFDRRALCSICALIEQDQRLAVALMDRAWPVDVDGEAQAIQVDVAIRTLLDVPRPAPFAFALCRQRIEVARTAPVAVASDENFSVEVPALCHRQSLRHSQRWIGG